MSVTLPRLHRQLRASLVLIVGATLATACSTNDTTTTGVHYRNGRWFDGTAFTARDAYVADGRFRATAPSSITRVVDLQGAFVVPAFGEAHNHNIEMAATFDAVERAYLHAGVFYVKIPGDIAELSSALRDRLNRPAGLDVTFSHGGFTSRGGHPAPLYQGHLGTSRYAPVLGPRSADWYEGRAYFQIDNVAELDVAWAQLLQTRPDFVKVYLLGSSTDASRSGNHTVAPRRGLDPTLVAPIVARAAAAGLRVSAHVETADDFRIAVSAGVAEIAHLPGHYTPDARSAQASLLTTADAAAAAQRDVTVVTTTWLAHTSPWPGNDVSLADATLAANLRTLRDGGVRIAIGSDHGASSLDEVRNLRRLGVFPPDVLLRLWAVDTPRVIFPDRLIGRLDDGYEGTFVAVACNPLDDFSCVERIQLRVKQGQELAAVPAPEGPAHTGHPAH